MSKQHAIDLRSGATRTLVFILRVSFWMLLLTPAAHADVKLDKLKAPSEEWEKAINEAGAEVEFYLKASKGDVNVTVRTFPNISQSAKTFLEVTADEMQKNSDYKGVNLGQIHDESRGGKKWDVLEIGLPAKMKQVLLARKMNSNTVLVVMYTALNEVFEKYQPGLEEIVKQAAR